MSQQDQLYRPQYWRSDHSCSSAPSQRVLVKVLYIHEPWLATPGLHVQQKQANRRGSVVPPQVAQL